MRSAKWESKIVPVALHNGTIPLMAEHRRWVHFTEWSSKEKVRQMLSFCCSRQTNVAFLIGIRGLHIGRGIFCTLNTPVEIYLFKVASKLPDLGHRLKCVHVDEISFQHARFHFNMREEPFTIHAHIEGHPAFVRSNYICPRDARMTTFSTLTLHRMVDATMTDVFDCKNVLKIDAPMHLAIPIDEFNIMRLSSKFLKLETLSWGHWVGETVTDLRCTIAYLMTFMPALKKLSVVADFFRFGVRFSHAQPVFVKCLTELNLHVRVRKWIDYVPQIEEEDVIKGLENDCVTLNMLSFIVFEDDSELMMKNRRVCFFFSGHTLIVFLFFMFAVQVC